MGSLSAVSRLSSIELLDFDSQCTAVISPYVFLGHLLLRNQYYIRLRGFCMEASEEGTLAINSAITFVAARDFSSPGR
jgi:hypothetical protein